MSVRLHERGKSLVIRDVRIVADADALYRAGAQLFADVAGSAVRQRGRFAVALSGGSTPRGLYTLLAGDPGFRAAVAWDQVEVYWGDERHVPPEHIESNYRMAQEALLSRVPVRDPHVHRIPAELTDPDAAATAYEETLRRSFRLAPGEFPRFDLILLGLGPDAHTASLFPGSPALQERARLVVANRIAAGDARITLTVPAINSAAHVVFLASGANKAGAVRAVIECTPEPQRFPAQLIRPVSGGLTWILDSAAAGLLS